MEKGIRLDPIDQIKPRLESRHDIAVAILNDERDVVHDVRVIWLYELRSYLDEELSKGDAADLEYAAEIRKAMKRLHRQIGHFTETQTIREQTRERVRRFRARKSALAKTAPTESR